MHNPAKFLCMTFHTTHKKVKIKNGIINIKSKILILLDARMCCPVVQLYAP